jgi:hypothetical protein
VQAVGNNQQEEAAARRIDEDGQQPRPDLAVVRKRQTAASRGERLQEQRIQE